MRYRRFGKTGLQLSIFSLGTMRYLASQEIAIQTVQKAVSLGINHLETARGYGNSEKYLGAALSASRGLVREQLYLTSKIPPMSSADQMEHLIDQSLERLKVDYLDCLAIHGLNTAEQLAWIEDPQGCMQAVHRAIADGRVRHVGFSTHASLEIILRAITTDLFEFVNLHYYFFNQRNAAAVAAAHQKDMGVFIISPADKGGMLYTPPQTLIDLCQPFTPLALTYRFLLSDSRITTLSVGAANPTELEAPLQVAELDGMLTMAEIEALQRLEVHAVSALATDRCSQCDQCLPCPESINIPEVLRLRNLAVAYNMTEFGQYRYRMFENAGHWFPGRTANRCTDCGDCLPRCPEQLDIPSLLRDTHQQLNGSARRRLWE
jgi:predicted aldo/keto reductase-like oxidoreductase